MIIFINGAFGVGKTTLAEQLVERIENSLLFDAEDVGICLSHIVQPIEAFDDFQDLPMWRTLTIETARQLKQTYRRTLIMPMTIWHRPYFEEVMAGLRQDEDQLYHFCLTASAETIAVRLHLRNYFPETHAFSYEHIEPCVAAFKSPLFAMQLDTEEKTPEELAKEIQGCLP
jgi:hypothetical protein